MFSSLIQIFASGVFIGCAINYINETRKYRNVLNETIEILSKFSEFRDTQQKMIKSVSFINFELKGIQQEVNNIRRKLKDETPVNTVFSCKPRIAPDLIVPASPL